ncbi:MAG: hypothetical protein IPL74_17890 [Bacteroidetes bacterium]|nr:hypothetical protein [Bacteroidota bacterium]
MQEKGRDEENGISAKILVKNAMPMQEKGRDEVKQECKILNVLFFNRKKNVKFYGDLFKKKKEHPFSC